MPEQTGLQPAYVLHRRPYSNTSALLELFTLQGGRLPVIARGTRAGARPGSGLLQPFVPLLCAWTGRGEVKTLRHCDPAGRAAPLQGRALYCGFYLNELLMRLLGRHDACAALFEAYGRALEGLASGGDLEPRLRRFELRLLEELGYGLQLEADAETGRPLTPGRRYRYEIERGPVEAAVNGTVETYAGETLLALASGAPLAATAMRESRHLLRGVLGHYLDGRPLRSRELFERR
jgi:DNA repair protein RecO (recombination protein O)